MKEIVFIGMICLLVSTSEAQDVVARKANFNVRKDVALEGYDPVSYFDHSPKEGREEISFTFGGIRYWFSSPENLARFKKSPSQYEPAYGGWCAYAMGAEGEKVKINPHTYKVVNGTLYLFYNFWGNNTLKEWEKNENQLKTAADSNWKKLIP